MKRRSRSCSRFVEIEPQGPVSSVYTSYVYALDSTGNEATIDKWLIPKYALDFLTKAGVRLYPEHKEPIMALRYFIEGSGKPRELPDSLLEELIDTSKAAYLRQNPEVGSTFVADYSDYLSGRSYQDVSLLSPLQATIGGYSCFVVSREEKIISIMVIDRYDWNLNLVTKIPKRVIPLLGILGGFKDRIVDSDGNLYEDAFACIGKGYLHYKFFSFTI